VQPDDDLAFERIVNVPKRGLGTASLRSVHLLARDRGIPLLAAAARLTESDELKPQARASLVRLLADLARWRELLARVPHPDLARMILDESGYAAMWRADRSPEAAGRLENLKELVVALAEFESMQGFLEHVSLVMDNDEAAGDDKIALMTLHAAKGLEFDTVFLPGWEEGLFPNQRALEEGGAAALEEERRLAYVGLTRARGRAIVSYAANRLVYGYWQNALPSRFIGELPAENVVQTAPTGLFGAELRRRAASAERAWPETGATALADARWASRRTPPPLIEGRAERVTARPEPAHPFTPGQRVFHQKFGYGSVRAVDGDRLEIAFEKAGTKTVIHSFVEAA
jgi:DNA helicase-2/ATP-dependent DNA helicase PcrA